MATFASVEETAQKLLNEFLEAGKQILIDDMDSKKRNASGKTKAAIRTANVTDKAGQLIGPEHRDERVFSALNPVGIQNPQKTAPVLAEGEPLVAQRFSIHPHS